MSGISIPITAVVLLLALAQSAVAQCIDDRRSVTVENERLELKTYSCRIGGIRVKAEFHRFNGDTASVLISGGSSQVIATMIGEPRIVRNDVVNALEDLFNRFAETYETRHTTPSYDVAVPGGGVAWADSPITGISEVKSLGRIGGFFYPAVDEIRALSRGSIPRGLSHSGNKAWRFITLEDLRNYPNRVVDYNRTFSRVPARTIHNLSPSVDLMIYLAREGLPPEFNVIDGFDWDNADQGCLPLGWSFWLEERILIMDAVIVENLTGTPLTVNALRGAESSGGLRPAKVSEFESRRILNLDARLAPGERILVPTRIVLAPSDGLRSFTSTSYLYGPALSVTGLVVDNQQIDFSKRRANFMQVALFPEIGSCPYLLSWNSESRDWIQRGKILDAANGQNKELQEIVNYTGFRNRFRLEEREPEFAYIDEAQLTVHLNDGASVELIPDRMELAARDSSRVVLAWAEAVEFSFSLPPHLDPSAVERSELRVTGYYERYPAITAPHLPSREVSPSLGFGETRNRGRTTDFCPR